MTAPAPRVAESDAAPPSVEGAAPDSDSARGFYGWRIVRTLAVAQTVSWGILYYAFTVLLLPMQRDLGFSTATLTGAFSLAVAVTGIAAVPVGRWVDRHGARALMSCGSAAGAVLVVAWSRVETVPGLYATFAGIGLVSAAVLYEPAFAVAIRWFHRQRAQALLAITLVAGFASTIFLPTTAYLEHTLGWRHALWVLAAVLAAGTVLPYALVLRRDPRDLGLHPDGVPGPAAASEGTGVAPERATLLGTARWVARDRRFWLLTLAYAAQTLAVAVVAVHLVPFLLEHGHSGGFAALAAGSLGALSVTGRLTVTGAIRRWPITRVAGAVFALQGAGCLVLLRFGDSSAGALAFVLMFGIGFGVGTITRPALTADAFGSAAFATVAALIGIALTAAKAAGPVSAGVLRTDSGGYTSVLVVVTVACLVAAVAVWHSGSSGTGHRKAGRQTPPGAADIDICQH